MTAEHLIVGAPAFFALVGAVVLVTKALASLIDPSIGSDSKGPK